MADLVVKNKRKRSQHVVINWFLHVALTTSLIFLITVCKKYLLLEQFVLESESVAKSRLFIEPCSFGWVQGSTAEICLVVLGHHAECAWYLINRTVEAWKLCQYKRWSLSPVFLRLTLKTFTWPLRVILLNSVTDVQGSSDVITAVPKFAAERSHPVTDAPTFQHSAPDRAENAHWTCQASVLRRCTFSVEQSAGRCCWH